MELNVVNLQLKSKEKKLNRTTAFDVIVLIVFVFFAAICVYPFLHMLLISFASEGDYYRANILVLPRHFNLKSYEFILLQGRIGFAFLESIFISAVYIVYTLTLTSFGAYALSKKNMPGNRIFFIFVLITMFFGGGLIPFYLTVRSLGLINSYFSVIIPFGINVFYMIILRNFFRQVPEALIESCKLDGAREFVIFWYMVMPLSKAGLITIGLFYFVDKWNDWYWPLMFIMSEEKSPLALEIRNLLTGNSSIDYSAIDKTYQKGKEAAMIVISILPMLGIIPFCQKFLTKGIMVGSVKE